MSVQTDLTTFLNYKVHCHSHVWLTRLMRVTRPLHLNYLQQHMYLLPILQMNISYHDSELHVPVIVTYW